MCPDVILDLKAETEEDAREERLTEDKLKYLVMLQPVQAEAFFLLNFSYRISTMKSLGSLTAAIDLLFSIIDPKLRKAYRAAYQRLGPGEKMFCTTEDPKQKLFPLRAILVDSDDWIGGWAWISPFGSFSGGDFCLPQLGVRIPLPPGGIAGLRGKELIHFTDKWSGSRYSIVHFFKESIRRCVRKHHQPLETTTSSQVSVGDTIKPPQYSRNTSKRVERKKKHRINRAAKARAAVHHGDAAKKARATMSFSQHN
ncbi:hypothetical protein FGG08_003143 [Glutinoglossum americanum]|uniref:Uncharacterized protein n=1 Tax=Glutinoglossum americanum TaxID=1670608 RepID=A0A9P8IBM6_9PEZI|nr:hypothetical protein FGG08_003143 [Glutinoglossum americanum]